MWCVWNGNSLFSSPLSCQNALQLCFSEYPIFAASDKVPRKQNSKRHRLLIQNDYLICYLPQCSSPITSFCTLSVVPRRVVIFTNNDHKREGGNENLDTPFTLSQMEVKEGSESFSMEVAPCYSGLLFLRPHKESPW